VHRGDHAPQMKATAVGPDLVARMDVSTSHLTDGAHRSRSQGACLRPSPHYVMSMLLWSGQDLAEQIFGITVGVTTDLRRSSSLTVLPVVADASSKAGNSWPVVTRTNIASERACSMGVGASCLPHPAEGNASQAPA
jgi:hypothetical protein